MEMPSQEAFWTEVMWREEVQMEGGGADGGIVKRDGDNGGEFLGWEPLARRRKEREVF